MTHSLCETCHLGDDAVACKLSAKRRNDGHVISDCVLYKFDEVVRLKTLLSKSVRVEMVDFPDGERGCRFIVGEDHVVAEWRGDGISADTVFVEEPALTYFKTTSPLDRCVRMTMEMVHWEIACAMLTGPGDGKLLTWAEKLSDFGHRGIPPAFIDRWKRQMKTIYDVDIDEAEEGNPEDDDE